MAILMLRACTVSTLSKQVKESNVQQRRWINGVEGIAYGGDYNAEQWPEQTWTEDIELMKQMGVNLVTVGVFSWALLEPAEGQFDFSFHDRILGLLDDAGIGVDLATPTVVPPAWFWKQHPEARVVTKDGVTLGHGSRGMASPSSAAYREAIARVASTLAERYGSHPAVRMWHLHNEYGVPISECYGDESVAAFRAWLKTRYGTIDALNTAWGNLFWGQLYREWDEIDAPRRSGSVVNQSMQLDFSRFSNDQLIGCMTIERDAIRAHSDLPVTTNFMAGETDATDYWKWRDELDIISNDHYLDAERRDNYVGLAMAADLTRSYANGEPWVLMEHSTSAVNWRDRNIAKRPGEMQRNSLQHMARGADAIMFFQLRASRFGAEKFHSAMIPQGGTDTRVYREVVDLGGALKRLTPVRGSRVRSRVAIVWDRNSFWASGQEWHPSIDLDPRERTNAMYAQLWHRNVTVDFVHPSHDLSGYALVILPQLYLVSGESAANLARYVDGGGTLFASYFSGIVDETDTVPVGPYPGQLRGVLGLSVSEFLPLYADQAVQLSGGGSGTIWSEEIKLDTADAVQTFVDGPAAGGAALTVNRVGAGRAYYLATALHGDDLGAVIDDVLGAAGVDTASEVHRNLERITRVADTGEAYEFLINHSELDYAVAVPGAIDELITGEAIAAGTVPVPAGAARVVRVVR